MIKSLEKEKEREARETQAPAKESKDEEVAVEDIEVPEELNTVAEGEE